MRVQRWEKATEWPLTATAAVFLVGYSVEVLARPAGVAARLVDLVIWITWAIFAVDFAVRLVLAHRRWHWLGRHLLDLGAVALPVLRPLRVIRLVALLRVVERAAGRKLHGRVAMYAVAGAIMIVYVGGLAELEAERSAPGSTIHTFGDALWWAATTITTVGYGDRFPVTAEGRLIAVGLMIAGVAMLGMITATLAAWLVDRVSEQDQEQQAATRAQVATLQDQVQTLNDRLEQVLHGVAGSAEFEPGRESDPAP